MVMSLYSKANCQTDSLTKLKGPYFGQKPPGKIPQIFAPEIFNEPQGYHHPVFFSGDLNEAFWVNWFGGEDYQVMYSRMLNNIWTAPKPINFGHKTASIGLDATISLGGNRLYYLSRDLPHSGAAKQERIWYVDRIQNRWSKPKVIDEVITKHRTHWTFSLAKNKNLYFTSDNRESGGGQRIYLSRYEGSKYLKPEDLGNAINSGRHQFAPTISPDESYIIFTKLYEKTFTSNLYISFKKPNGSWTEAVKLNYPINSDSSDYISKISPDGKYLFFLSQRDANNRIYWVDVSFIEELRP